MGDEADYLESQGDGGAADHMREEEEQDYIDTIEAMKSQYRDNKRAEVGATIICPCCKKRIVKTTYHRVFCKRKKCKDVYWNNTDPKRRQRAQHINR